MLHVLDCVGAEADRMEDADRVEWSVHWNAIDEDKSRLGKLRPGGLTGSRTLTCCCRGE